MQWLTAIVKPVSDVLTAGQKRKQAKEQGINEIRKAHVDGENTLNLTDAQWEAVTAEGNAETWKDEYVTVCMTAWIWVALYGALFDEKALEGVQTFLTFCVANEVNIGWLTMAVVTAAVGLKAWRGLK